MSSDLSAGDRIALILGRAVMRAEALEAEVERLRGLVAAMNGADLPADEPVESK